jgi:small subunit ribosomal protein S16
MLKLAFKAEQDVNAKRLATAAKLKQTLSPLLLLKKKAEVESTEETPAAEENNEEENSEMRKKIVST